MKKRHAYARVTRGLEDIEVVAGVGLVLGEKAPEVYKRTSRVLGWITARELRVLTDDELADTAERLLKFEFPDLVARGYFIEVGRGVQDEYVQVYVPA